MILLQIRRAEVALADGRLDEAFELARVEPVRAHRRGQRLVTNLARRLTERAEAHLAAAHPRQALADCARAQQLAGNQDHLARVRAQAIAAIDAEQRRRDRVGQRLREIDRDIDAGELSLAGGLLEKVDDSAGLADGARQRLARRRTLGERALTRAVAAKDHDDPTDLIDHLLQAKRHGVNSEAFDELLATTRTRACEAMRQAIDDGRLDLAQSILDRLQPLAGGSLQVQQFGHLLTQCRQAAQWMQRHDPRRAVTILHRLRPLLPDAAWVRQAAEQAEAAADGVESLRRGPLGLVSTIEVSDNAHSRPASGTRAASSRSAVASRHRATSPGQMPMTGAMFMMQIDGVGGFLVCAKSRVSLGPVSSAHRPDVGLVADPHLPLVTIERVEEDYFLQSPAPAKVNGRACERALLKDGDRIDLSSRCRIKFRRPNPASTSAALVLTGARLLNQDTRQVLLLDRELVIGPQRTAHVPAGDLPEPIVLRYDGGRLTCGSSQPITVDDEPITGSAAIPLDARVRIGSLSLVITPVGRS